MGEQADDTQPTPPRDATLSVLTKGQLNTVMTNMGHVLPRRRQM